MGAKFLPYFIFVALILFSIFLITFYLSHQQTTIGSTTTTKITTTTTAPKTIFTFTFAGDVMLGRDVGYFFQNDFSKLFDQFGNRTFWGTDLSWLNLEGPINENEVQQNRDPNNLVFNFSKSAIDALKFLKINSVGLANNHTLNQGQNGFTTTQKILQNAGIDYFGFSNKNDEGSIKRIDKDNLKISLIATNVLSGTDNVDNLIKQEKGAGRFVIVLPHWGNEYQAMHSQNQEKLAKDWIQNGADLIIGSHPHVIQDAQIIDNKLVFYSLGNFVFDQLFSEETQRGLILTGVLENNQLKIVLVPTASKKMKPYILQGEEKQKIINQICKNLENLCQDDTITKSML